MTERSTRNTSDQTKNLLRTVSMNSVHLSAEFVHQAFKAISPKFVMELPTGGRAHISLRNLRINKDRVLIEVHNDIPVIPDFEVALSQFEARGTSVRTHISHAGILSEDIVAMIADLAQGHLKRMLQEWPVRVHGNIITVDFESWLPIRGIEITHFEVNDGVTLEFDYTVSDVVESLSNRAHSH
jgi:hypothetical protein